MSPGAANNSIFQNVSFWYICIKMHLKFSVNGQNNTLFYPSRKSKNCGKVVNLLRTNMLQQKTKFCKNGTKFASYNYQSLLLGIILSKKVGALCFAAVSQYHRFQIRQRFELRLRRICSPFGGTMSTWVIRWATKLPSPHMWEIGGPQPIMSVSIFDKWEKPPAWRSRKKG